MSKINCLVVDDEELARTLLKTYIDRLPNLDLIGSCKNPLEALPLLQENKVDLIFLDIQMPELTGIEFLKSIRPDSLVIFTTAYSEYALEGYALDVIDYLLKPFSFDRFVQAVNKADEYLRLKRAAHQPKAIIANDISAEKDYLLVKSEHKIYKIKFSDIDYIQSMREYVAYYTPKGRILSLQSLKKLEETLPGDAFIRIHKSYIVAIPKVTTLEGNMVHIGKEKLPIGSNYKEQVLKKIF